jgi:hypothetical protein
VAVLCSLIVYCEACEECPRCCACFILIKKKKKKKKVAVEDDSGDEAAAASGSDNSDEEDEKPKKEDRGQIKRFDFDEFDSSSDEKRVILTASEKLIQQLQESVGRLTDALELQSELKQAPKGHDTSTWPIVPSFVEAKGLPFFGLWKMLIIFSKDEVESGLLLLGKYKKAVDESGVPGFYIRALARFVDNVTAVSELAKKDKIFANVLPKDVAKQMVTVARYAQKSVVEGKLVGPGIAEFRKDPTAERWLDPAAKQAADDDLSEDEQKEKTKAGPKRGTREFWVKQPGDTSSESDGGDASWLDDSQESGEEKGEKEEKKAAKAKPGAKTKKHKLKAATTASKAEVDSNEEEDDEQEDARALLTSSKQRQEPLEEEKDLKAEDVDRLTTEMSMLRGRKGTDYPRLLQRLELIVPKAKTDVQRVRLLILFVNTRFDGVRTSKSRLSAKDWRLSVDNIKQILRLLRANPSFRLMELDTLSDLDDESESLALSAAAAGGDESAVAAAEDAAAAKKKEQLDRNKGLAANVIASGKVVISGSLFALLERLDSAFVRTLQQIDPHTQEYLTRLSDDPEFVVLAREMLAYQVSIADTEGAAKTAHSIMSHMYFKGSVASAKADTAELQQLAKIIYDNGGARLKAQAMLMSIYHLALNDDFEEARDRMLMSHLQDKAALMDIETQILFNRTNVQIGLCAFRNGLIREAHSALSEIYAGGRVKELLAQGTSSQRYQDKDKEQEKVEKSRMMPFHMHINLELLETCHLIAAMMLEVPVMAAERYSRGAVLSDNKIMSKLKQEKELHCVFLFILIFLYERYLRKLVDYHERQVFAGPPETTRDFVVAAARALSRGNWRKTTRLLLNMPAWDLLEKKDKVYKTNTKTTTCFLKDEV